MPDYISIPNNDTIYQMTVIQVWVDPKYPAAHQDTGLREYLKREADQKGCAALIRYGARDGCVLMAPMSEGQDWLELQGTPEGRDHTTTDIFQHMAKAK
jgi:hypothetical protein